MKLSFRHGYLLALWLVSIFVLLFSAFLGQARAAVRPNIVVVQVDDMSPALLRAKIKRGGKMVPALANLTSRVEERGTLFRRYYVSNPVCSPSRATMFSGKAAHNHDLNVNGQNAWERWLSSDFSAENLPVWMERAGYRTAHIGKYINRYGSNNEFAVPPGWNRWVGPIRNGGAAFYGSRFNVDGEVGEPVGSWRDRDASNCVIALPTVANSCKHSTDMYAAYAVQEIVSASFDERPLYLQVDFNAPHEDGALDPGPTPPARLVGLETSPLNLIDNSPVGSGAPRFIRSLAPIDNAYQEVMRERWANEVRSLAGVDEAIGMMLDRLRDTGQLNNTYFVFLSDNGFFHGEHRVSYGKYLPHEPATRQPLIIRGPGIPAGKQSSALASNLDFASTVLDACGVKNRRQLDGISLLPFARSPQKGSSRAVPLEGFNGRGYDDPTVVNTKAEHKNQTPFLINYTGFVAGPWKYIRYAYGEEELYNLSSDPDEKKNLAVISSYSGRLKWARGISATMKRCQGAEKCRPVVSGA